MSDTKKGGMKRRDFLKIIGVAGGTAAVAGGCSPQPVEQIIPYVIPPDDIIPGIPKWYASTCTECPAGCGILVKNREGRAIKIEGNPLNPINSGSLCARGQSALQGLYNPDRIRGPLSRNTSGRLEPISWDSAEKALVGRIQEIRKKGKANGIVFLTNHIGGSLGKLMDEWLGALGGKRVVYETFAHEPIREANRIAFGMDKIPTYHIEKTKYLLSFGADFLETWLSPTEYAKRFSQMHGYRDKTMGRFVQVEPRLSLTGASADEWVSIKPGTEAFLALGIANVILSEGLSSISSDESAKLANFLSGYTTDRVSSLTEVPQETIRRISKEFVELKPSLAIGGGAATTSSNATSTLVAINILNYMAGNIGDTVNFGESLTVSQSASFKEIASLVDSMSRGEVELLVIYNVNPAFTLPDSIGFEEALKRVPFVVSFSSFMDETTELANLILPDHTALERWGDYIPREGVYGLIQPVMSPVFNTKPTGDVILSISKGIEGLKDRFTWSTFYDYLRDSWRNGLQPSLAPEKDFETFWREAVEAGGVFKEVEPIPVRLSDGVLGVTFAEPRFEGQGDMYLIAYPSYRYYDGRGANKPWLQELPDALTTAVWDSWVEINPQTADRLGIAEGDFLSIESPYGRIETQAFIYKGIRPDTVAIPLGLGHTSYGRYAQNRGVNPIDILPVTIDEASGGFAWLSTRVKVSRTGRRGQLVKTQYSMGQHGREVARAVTLGELARGVHRERKENPTMYPPQENPKYRWGMSIDLSKCIGCGACVTACYAENNIAIVGKEQIGKRREMSWIRIERYFEEEDGGEGFETRFIPMLCQQCGNAPCEPVCPVYATYHNQEGLNAMVYNRCVGTRYCSNNCTYKVRRFNWFQYKWPEPLNWQLNPDVTVRGMGVMEKCTFCVQRISFAKDRAKDEGRDVRDGEVMPACAQACPTKVIVFGNLKDPESEVS
ncbi:MAG TPA: molybdopterin-dependent oxidoreductase, partial [Thermodesulfobacteriota bacterium]|nr:molybdopterin-dependent oxidoreductase [Thermodesulfobacteriota bacterium]